MKDNYILADITESRQSTVCGDACWCDSAFVMIGKRTPASWHSPGELSTRDSQVQLLSQVPTEPSSLMVMRMSSGQFSVQQSIGHLNLS